MHVSRRPSWRIISSLFVLIESAYAAETRIVLLGESTTAGSYGGWRAGLEQRLVAAGWTVNFVSTGTTASGGADPRLIDKDHDGAPGRKTSDLLAGFAGGFNIAALNPDIVTFLIGHNGYGVGSTQTLTEIGQCLDQIHAQVPNAEIHVMPHFPNTDPTVTSGVLRLAYAPRVALGTQALVRTKAALGWKIHYVDLHGLATGNEHIGTDGIHPWDGDSSARAAGLYDSPYDRYAPVLAQSLIAQRSLAGNSPPTVSLAAPASDVSTALPFIVDVNASDADGTISAVEVYLSGAKVANASLNSGTTSNGVWRASVTNVPPGAYDLRVKAIDNRGAAVSTFPVPANDATAPTPRTVTVTGTPTANLLAHWTFDEAAGFRSLDQSGHNRHIAFASIWDRSAGVATGSISAQPFKTLNATDANPTTQFTFVTRIKSPGTSTDLYPTIFSKGALKVGTWNGTREVFAVIGGNVRSGLLLPNDTWSFLAVTYNAGAVFFRIDSQSASKTATITTIPANASPLDMMYRLGGSLDDVRFYDRALSDAELIAIRDGSGGSPGTLAVANAAISQAEGNSGTANVTVSVTRSGGSTGAVGVSYATSNGSATAGSDYTATSGTLAWAAGDAANKSFTVAIVGDTTVETDETVTLTLTSPTGGATLGTAVATLTITNDDVAAPVGTLAFATAAISQAEGNSGTANATITVTRTGGSSGAVGVSYATSNGTAVAGSDYTATSGSLTWADGDAASKSFTVAIAGDTTFETDETVTLALSGATGGASLGTAAATLTITNDDAAPVGTLAFATAAISQAEGNSGTTNATFTVTRTGGSSGAVGVSYATSDSSATAGSDYTAASGSLSWADGDAASKSFTVAIAGDTTFEADETVSLALSTPTGGASLGTAAATLTITNDDAAPVGTLAFSTATISQAEGNSGSANATITVTRTGGSNGAVGVSYATSDGSATAGSDYTATSGSLSWANGDVASKSFTVSITGDTTVETNETVTLSLSGATGGASLGTATATLTITNDDAPSAGILAFAASVSQAEGTSGTANATITVTRTGGSSGAVGVSYATSDGSATAGSDYTATSGSLAWAAGDAANKSFTVAIAGDTTFEADETINLALSAPTGGASLGTASATLTIANDDAAPVGTLAFATAAISQAEGHSGTTNATITVTRTGGSNGAVSVSYATSNGTATAGSDYTATSGSLTWADGDAASKSFTVAIAGDTNFETDETVTLALSGATGGASLGTAAATLTITNDDAAPVGTLAFSTATISQAEGNSGTANATIIITRTGGSSGAVGVSYATSDGSATAGSDYTAASGSLSWADGDAASKSFTVAIAGDTTFEADETVTLALSTPTGGASLGTAAATLTITNDDAAPVGTLAFSTATVSQAEGNSSTANATITVTRTGGSNGAVGVSYATSDGTASAGSDYTAASGALAWADGDATSKTFTVAIAGDVSVEGDETVNLTLSGATGGASLGTAAATLTITNDDAATTPIVTVAAGDADLAEGATPDPGSFILTRTGSALATLDVQVSVDGTATAGADYTALPTVVSFTAGSATAVVPVTVLDDTRFEGDESVILIVGAGAGYDVGAAAIATLTIRDDDLPVVTVTVPDPSAAEVRSPGTPDAGRFTLTRVGDLTSDLTVRLSIGGSATPDLDYLRLPDAVTFAAGSASVDVPVDVLDDALHEGVETVAVSVVPDPGMLRIGGGPGVVAIGDDDADPTPAIPALGGGSRCGAGGGVGLILGMLAVIGLRCRRSGRNPQRNLP
jgi:hypothetical protein